MQLIRYAFAVLAALYLVAFQATPSAAQFDAVFLRSDGSDALTCADLQNRCVSLARGIDQADPGAINVLDSNVHAAIEIGGPLSIFALNGGNVIEESGIGIPSSGIRVSTSFSNTVVTLSGISIDQRGTLHHGLTMAQDGVLHIENCYIRGSGNGYGINLIPAGQIEVHISNCVIADNGDAATGGGILIQPTGTGNAIVVLDNVRFENNRVGIFVNRVATSGTVAVSVRNSKVTGNTTGIVANASGAVVRVANSTISGNVNGLLVFSGGQIVSHTGNVLTNNTTNGAFSSTVAQQ